MIVSMGCNADSGAVGLPLALNLRDVVTGKSSGIAPNGKNKKYDVYRVDLGR